MSLSPAFYPYCCDDPHVGLFRATLLFFSAFFYPSCSPGLQNFSITPSIFLNSCCITQLKCHLLHLTHSVPGILFLLRHLLSAWKQISKCCNWGEISKSPISLCITQRQKSSPFLYLHLSECFCTK